VLGVGVFGLVELELRGLVFEGDVDGVQGLVDGARGVGFACRVVRGRKMRRLGGVFDEFAAALQFGWFFGENPDAFDECVADLDDLPPRRGYVIVVTEPDQVMADPLGVDVKAARLSSPRLEWLASSLSRACEIWGDPRRLAEWWDDRPPVPFHVVLAGEADVLRVAEPRWRDAGWELRRLAVGEEAW
jgi:hypothetical protein